MKISKVLATVVTAGAISIAAAVPASAEKALLGHVMDSKHIFHKVSEKFTNKLNELSKGEVEIEYHPGGDLGDWTSIVEQVMQGSTQMTMTWNHSELDPRWDVSVLGYVANDWKSGRNIYGPGSAMENVYNGIMSDLGMVLLGVIPTDFTGYVVRKGVKVPTEFPQDAKGFKMRVPGMPMAIERYKSTGFSVIPMAFSEVHTALQTGAIDGRAYSPPSEVLLFKDVVSSYVFTKENFEHTFWVANKAWFEGLSKEKQGWIKSAASDAVNWAWDNAEKESPKWIEEIKAEGIDVIELSAEQLAAYKKLVVDVEYPYMEKIIGTDVMDQIRKAQAK